MRRLAVVLLLAASSACWSSAPSSFYALSPEGRAGSPCGFRTVKLRRPGVAGYLDRPEIVRGVDGYRLRVLDTDRWASPIDEMLGRVLSQDIEERLPGTSVFTEDGAITADADATVEVDVRRLDASEGGEVTLVAEVAIEKGLAHTPSGTRAVRLSQKLAGSTTPALVATMSALVGKLADEIAVLLRQG